MARRFRIRAPAPAPTIGLEIQVAQASWLLVRPAVHTAVRAIVAALPGLARARADAAEDADEIDELLERETRRAEAAVPKDGARRVAATAARRASKKADEDLGAQIKAIAGFDPLAGAPQLGKQVARAAREHAELITTIPRRYLRQLGDEVRRDFKAGRTVEEIAQRIERTYLDENPRGPAIARLIARDQVNKLIGAQNKVRQEALGIRKYRWRTQLDTRVRGNPGGRYPGAVPSHWAREGVVYEWDKPPPGGHPGQAILCRCYPEPVIDDPQKLAEAAQATKRPATQQVTPMVSERVALARVDPAIAKAWRASKRAQDARTAEDIERLRALREGTPADRLERQRARAGRSAPRRRPLVR